MRQVPLRVFFFENLLGNRLVANRLGMDKSLAISNLRSAGYSERRIAETLEISRGAVRRHLALAKSNSTKAQTGLAQTGSEEPNGTKAQTGSGETPAKRLLEASSAESQSTMDFMDSHPIIRSVSEYGDFIHESIQGG